MNIFKIVGAAGLLGLAGCQAVGEPMVRPTKEQRAPAEQLNFARLKPGLPGKNMRSVLKVLGQPNAVFDSSAGTNWVYLNAAYDRKAGRAVNFLKLIFVGGVVKRIEYTLAPEVW